MLKEQETILMEWAKFEKMVDYKCLDWCQQLINETRNRLKHPESGR